MGQALANDRILDTNSPTWWNLALQLQNPMARDFSGVDIIVAIFGKGKDIVTKGSVWKWME
jgi:hypothetical protein